jgi:hypothetical protein
MNMTTLIGIIALLILGATSAVLALWCHYKDGVFGHIALVVMALCALVVGIDVIDGAKYDFLLTTTVTLVAMAGFMLRHAYRAWRFWGAGK